MVSTSPTSTTYMDYFNGNYFGIFVNSTDCAIGTSNGSVNGYLGFQQSYGVYGYASSGTAINGQDSM